MIATTSHEFDGLRYWQYRLAGNRLPASQRAPISAPLSRLLLRSGNRRRVAS